MLADLAFRLRALFQRSRLERELSEELFYHFDRQVALFLEQGLPLDEARRRARLLFGGLDQLKEECRDARGISLLDSLWLDLRHSARLLARNPGIAVTGILSLALGVAGATVAFSLLFATRFQPLPVAAPRELAALRSPGPRFGTCWGVGASQATCFSYADYLRLRASNTVFTGLLARSNLGADLFFRHRTERISLELVSANFFDLLGAHPAAGRFFTAPQPAAPDAARAAVLSYEYWERRFHRDPTILGQTALVNNLPVSIVAVAARRFNSFNRGRAPELYVPIELQDALMPVQPLLSNTRVSWINLVARLKPGVFLRQAEEKLAPSFHQLILDEAATLPGSWPSRSAFLSRRLELVPAAFGIEPQTDDLLLSLSAIAVCVLLAAGANLAGLCLARAAARQKEIAIRTALGAGRARMVRQLLVEFSLPASAGCLLGLAIAAAAAPVLPRLLFDEPRARAASSTAGPLMLLAAFSASAVVVVLLGAAPSLLPALGRPLRALYTSAVPLSAGHTRLRKALLATQVALSASLVYGAFSFTGVLLDRQRLSGVPERSNVIMFHMDAGTKGYYPDRARSLFIRLEQRLASLPGVHSAGFSIGASTSIEIAGAASPPQPALWLQASPGLFSASGCRFAAGAAFDSARPFPSAGVVVNEAFTQRIFAGRDPMGKLIRPWGGVWAPIVGVVRDRDSAVFNDQPAVYSPYSGATTVTYFVRSGGPPEILLPAVKALIEREGAGVKAFEMKTTTQALAENARPARVLTAVLSAFGLFTMALAALGAYGITAYLLARRTPEIAVRISLGASPRRVVSAILNEVLSMVALGALAGAFLPPLACLFVVPVNGPDWRHEYPLLAAAILVVCFSTALAALVTALRAARIQPASALRTD